MVDMLKVVKILIGKVFPISVAIVVVRCGVKVQSVVEHVG